MTSMTQLAESLRASIREHEPYWDSDWSDGYVTCAKIILDEIGDTSDTIPQTMRLSAREVRAMSRAFDDPDIDYVNLCRSCNELVVQQVKKGIIYKIKPIWVTINLEGDEPVITTSEHDPEDKQ